MIKLTEITDANRVQLKAELETVWNCDCRYGCITCQPEDYEVPSWDEIYREVADD